MTDNPEFLRTVAAVVSSVLALGGFVGAWAVIPWRVRRLEQQVEARFSALDGDHDLLVTLNERSATIHAQLTDLKLNLNQLRQELTR